jgi:predicted secreted hydrolase
MNKLAALALFSLLVDGIGAAATPDPFLSALPGYHFRFPFDHGAHEKFQTEWWYFTGNLQGADGNRYGYELTFFRRGNRDPHVLENPSRWSVRQIYLAHFALTDPARNAFWYREKISREGMGKAGAGPGRLAVHIDDWRAEESGGRIRLRAREDGRAIDLWLTPLKPPALQGELGFSKKGPMPGEASHYYSVPRLGTEGSLRIEGREVAVGGLSWMDHEFFTFPGKGVFENDLRGWDWFSVQLENGFELMFYRLRLADGSDSPFSAGTLVSPEGIAHPLSLSEVRLTPIARWKSPRSGGDYPIQWRLEIPQKGIRLDLSPVLSDQELITRKSTRVVYWEGAIRAAGLWSGHPVSGKGYLELTGYAKLGPAIRP